MKEAIRCIGIKSGTQATDGARRLSEIRHACELTGKDPNEFEEYRRLLEIQRQSTLELQIWRMNAYNSLIGTIPQPMCPKCLNKGVVMWLRGTELVMSPCRCRMKKEEQENG